MARPDKQGIDYFSLDTHMEDKIKLVEAKYGMEGYGLLIKLWQKIYSHGYYINWKEEIQLLFSNEVNVNINLVNDVINSCLDWGVFNKNLYEKHNILTSHGIQLRYMKATSRRKEIEMIKEFNLLKEKELNSNVFFVDINGNEENVNKNHKSEGVNVNNNPNSPDKNDNISKQSKVKKNKVKKNKNNKTCSDSKKTSPNPSQKKPAESEPKFDNESRPYKAACYLRDKILENNKRAQVPDKNPNDMEDWATSMDRLQRLGPVGAKKSEDKGYSWKEIGRIIDWCQDHDFWKSNILSAGKLREQIVKLENQMQRASPQNKPNKKTRILKEVYQKAQQEEEMQERRADPI